MSDQTLDVPTIKPEAVPDRPSQVVDDMRPTAKILGDFRRELLAEKIPADTADDLVQMVAASMFDHGAPLVVNGRGEGGGAA